MCGYNNHSVVTLNKVWLPLLAEFKMIMRARVISDIEAAIVRVEGDLRLRQPLKVNILLNLVYYYSKYKVYYYVITLSAGLNNCSLCLTFRQKWPRLGL